MHLATIHVPLLCPLEATQPAVNRAYVHSSPKVETADGSQEDGSASFLSVTEGKEHSDSPNTSAP